MAAAVCYNEKIQAVQTEAQASAAQPDGVNYGEDRNDDYQPDIDSSLCPLGWSDDIDVRLWECDRLRDSRSLVRKCRESAGKLKNSPQCVKSTEASQAYRTSD